MWNLVWIVFNGKDSAGGLSCTILSKLAIKAHTVPAMMVKSTPVSIGGQVHALLAPRVVLGERWREVLKIKPSRRPAVCTPLLLVPFYGSNNNNRSHVTHLKKKKKPEVRHIDQLEILVKVIKNLRSNGCLQ